MCIRDSALTDPAGSPKACTVFTFQCVGDDTLIALSLIHIFLRDEEGVRHFALGGEGLTRTGRTQDQPVGVLDVYKRQYCASAPSIASSSLR